MTTHNARTTNVRAADAETRRLEEDAALRANWKRWGPYLAERQWGTVREDYSADGDCWNYFPHEHARRRAYRWGEDGLLGLCDRECRLCFALALWNERDPILKERLFGLTNPEGNHGEDVKEAYFYLDSTPTHSYVKGLYKYPQAEFPYARLVEENGRRSPQEPEFEIVDTGVFDGDRYFDVTVEYAKGGPDDILVRITVANRGSDRAAIHVLPTIWFRNTWSWERRGEGYHATPRIAAAGAGAVVAEHVTLGRFRLSAAAGPDGTAPTWLFTNNETNTEALFGAPNRSPFVKDAFHEYVVLGRTGAVDPGGSGTKAAAHYRVTVPPRGTVVLTLRLGPDADATDQPFGPDFDRIFEDRLAEADAFYAARIPDADAEQRNVARQAYAGLLTSKQFYHYAVREWLEGDPGQPSPPRSRVTVRNADWPHLYNRDVISMPDKWEYPWYAAWDLAFHAVAFARVDIELAKQQLLLVLREWYMHPNGQIPAYEFAFSDVNPPVHAWACWRVYKMSGPRGRRDRVFLARAFHKLLINFTWWVNRKDVEGKHLFSGGFLGLDNIGVFDRSRPLPTGGHLEQADGTAWMAFYCATMMAMALELAAEDPAYQDVASKFFEHFVAIADAMNTLGGQGLWDDDDGFYYDQLHIDGGLVPLKVRSMVGLIPLCAAEVLEADLVTRLDGFGRRLKWFLANRSDLARRIAYLEMSRHHGHHAHYLLAIPSRPRLERVLRYLFDEDEFLSPYGVRSVSRFHLDRPYVFRAQGEAFRVDYAPGESETEFFGGNSNWRGPIWFPLNYLLVEALERYDHFYGESLQVECPTGSGRVMTLGRAANELRRRLTRLFLPDASGRRPCHGDESRFAADPHWRDLVLYHEYFHGETGRGLGASHQTGWTALVARCLEDVAAAGEETPEAVAAAGSAGAPG